MIEKATDSLERSCLFFGMRFRFILRRRRVKEHQQRQQPRNSSVARFERGHVWIGRCQLNQIYVIPIGLASRRIRYKKAAKTHQLAKFLRFTSETRRFRTTDKQSDSSSSCGHSEQTTTELINLSTTTATDALKFSIGCWVNIFVDIFPVRGG